MEEIRDLLIHISGGCKYVFDESGLVRRLHN